MLLITEPEKFKLPTVQESVELLQKARDKDLEKYRLPDQDELVNEEARLGRPLFHNQFISKVLQLAPGIWVEDSLNWPGGMNFYRSHNGEKQCLNAPFVKGLMPEYSILHLDEKGLPYKKDVGWRDVLFRLMVAGVLTLAQCDKHFGKPTPTESDRWDKQTQHLR